MQQDIKSAKALKTPELLFDLSSSVVIEWFKFKT